MHVITTLFGSSKINPEYNRFLNTLLYSIVANTGAKIFVYGDYYINRMLGINYIEASVDIERPGDFASHKVKLFKKIIQDPIHHEKELIFLDVDMLVIGDIETVFDSDFDLAYTVNAKYGGGANVGFIAVRNSDKVIEFFCDWEHETLKCINHSDSMYFRKKYGSCDQAGFVSCLSNPGLNIKQVPHNIYNIHSGYNNIENGKAIHYKSEWKEVLFTDKPSKFRMFTECADLWHNYENRMLEWQAKRG